jgi:predicted enzyme related to lactoylglutathione lyase
MPVQPGTENSSYGACPEPPCADRAVEAARVVAAGGSVQKEKMSIAQHGFIALAIDTEVNMFGLHSMR